MRTAQTAQSVKLYIQRCGVCGVGVLLSPDSCPESESDSESASKSRTANPGTRPVSSSSMATLARPPTRSSLKITNRSFQYAVQPAPCLWNELPTDLRTPRQIQSPSLSPFTHGSSSSSPFSLSSPPSSPTRSVFQSELKTWLFGRGVARGGEAGGMPPIVD